MTATDKLFIDNSDDKLFEAIDLVDNFVSGKNVDHKKAIHLRLLTEETIGMVRAMTGDFEANFWMEEDNGEYSLKLNLKTEMDKEKKSELLSLSTSGENTAVKGFMGKIREVIENSLLDFDYTLKLQNQYENRIGYSYMGAGMVGSAPPEMPVVWSLNSYKDSLGESGDQEAWDELERSIVASLAKDVIVGVKNNIVNLTIVAR